MKSKYLLSTFKLNEKKGIQIQAIPESLFRVEIYDRFKSFHAIKLTLSWGSIITPYNHSSERSYFIKSGSERRLAVIPA